MKLIKNVLFVIVAVLVVLGAIFGILCIVNLLGEFLQGFGAPTTYQQLNEQDILSIFQR